MMTAAFDHAHTHAVVADASCQNLEVLEKNYGLRSIGHQSFLNCICKIAQLAV